METIKISQESLDAFKKEKELIPAPIDNKNVVQDWIEEIFDYQTCIWGEKKSAIGYVHGQPVIAAWYKNILLWKFTEEKEIENSDHLAELRNRLNNAHDPNGNLIEEFKVIGNILMQKFYWKDEE